MKYKFGLALAGGGSRGAYAAGVMRYLFTGLPKKIGFIPWPKLVSGTSVGALNGYFAACHDLSEVYRMQEIWSEMKADHVFTFYSGGTFGTIRYLMGISTRGYLLGHEPLRQLIEKEAARRSLRKSIEAQKCQAYIVSATHLNTGEGFLFVESNDPNFSIPPPPVGNVVYSKIYPPHLIASSSIPVLFPPEKIGDQYFVDGGVRQNAPLHPILYGGAERILVIGTRHPKDKSLHTDTTPSLSLIAGKTLNALTLDPIERDTRNTELINDIIRWGNEVYGDDFGTRLKQRHNIHQTEILHIRPSQDLGTLVMECFDPQKNIASKNIQWLFNKLYQQGKEVGNSDLLSQILFDSCYTKVAEQLGYNDAQNKEEELIELFLG